MHQSGKLAVSQEDRKPLPLLGFLPLLLAACQPVNARYGQQNLSLSENQATGGEIGLSFEATDADTPQDQLVWDVTDNRFELRAKSDGRYHLVLKDGQILDYEDSRNPGGNLDLAVLVWDGLHTAVHYLRLQFSDVNDHASVFTSQAQKQVAPNLGAGAEIYQAVTTDADGTAANRAVSYSLSGADAGKLSINATNGKVILNSPPTASSYSFTVTATNGALSTAQEVTINFTGNLSPVLVGSGPPDLHLTGGLAFADQTLSGYFSDPEGQSLSFSASGLPSGLTLSSSGVLSGSLTNAMSGSYSVTLTASDPQGASASDQFTLTIGQSYTDTDGDDVLTGTGYRDFFNLGFNGGTDKIDGGAGSDILSLASWTGNSNGGGGGGEETEESAAGGAAADLFVFAGTDYGRDMITDYSQSAGDILRLEDIAAADLRISTAGETQTGGHLLIYKSGQSSLTDTEGNYLILGNIAAGRFQLDLRASDSSFFAGQDFTFGTSGNDSITGTAGRDIVWAFGGDDQITGGATADTLFGMGGNDTLSGGAGDDRLEGGSGADTLNGGAGSDQLNGGDGADIADLSGGGGSDIFVNYKFSTLTVAGSEDVITDFLDGTDLIGLEKAHSGSTAVTFSDLTLTSVTRQDGGTDTRITAGSKYLWLVENTAPADFSVADFIAVGLASDGFA